jgi:D-amino-acid dehydrogenase
MNNTKTDVIVVGGGIIGLACAHFLRQSGRTVTIVEQKGIGEGCSHANCGFVSPSHVLPLAGPGAVGKAVKALLQPNGPLCIRFRLDPTFWSWLYHFARRCNTRDMLASGRGIQALLNSSRGLYDQLMKEPGIDCEWEPHGMLLVLDSQAGMEHQAETDKLLRETFNMPAQRFDGAAVNELEPALKPGVAGGWLYEMDAHLRPDKLLTSWHKLVEERGVVIRERCPVTAISRESGQARAIGTPQGELTADTFVFATGAYTPLLNEQLGCRIPIQPGKGYSMTMARPRLCPSRPLIFEEHRVAVTPMKSAYRLGSTMEFAGYDATLNPKRLALLQEAARHYLHEPMGEPIEEQWFGWRPMTYDGMPIIDRSPALANVWIAAGHNMLGLSMAPATGRLVTEMLNGQSTHLDPTPYSLRRFS